MWVTQQIPTTKIARTRDNQNADNNFKGNNHTHLYWKWNTVQLFVERSLLNRPLNRAIMNQNEWHRDVETLSYPKSPLGRDAARMP